MCLGLDDNLSLIMHNVDGIFFFQMEDFKSFFQDYNPAQSIYPFGVHNSPISHFYFF